MMQEGSLVELHHTAHSPHDFLHLSVLFSFGLVMLTSDDGHLIVVAVDLYIALPLIPRCHPTFWVPSLSESDSLSSFQSHVTSW